MIGGGFVAGSIIAKLQLDKTGWTQGMHQVQRDMDVARQSAEKTSAGLREVGTRMALVGGAIVAAMGLTVKAFSEFDDAMTQSLAIMGEISDLTKEKLVHNAQEVARQTTFSAAKAAGAYYYLASAGLSAEESMEALPAVAKFAQAGMFDLERATTYLADAQSALGLRIRDDAVKNMENMVRVSDVLSEANILSNASIEQFSEALTERAGAALKMVGKDIEEGAAVLSVMANQGIKGAEAGTRLDIVLRDLQTRAIKSSAAMEKYGITVFDSTGDMRNMADIIADLEKAMAGMSDEQRRAALLEMDFQDRSVASILMLIGMSDEIRRMEGELRKAGGTTDEIAEKQLVSLKSQLQLTKNEMVLLSEAIGSTLAPFVKSLAVDIRNVIKFFTGLVEGNKGVVGALAVATTAFGALAVAVGVSTIALAAWIKSVGVVTTAVPGLTGVLGGLRLALWSLAPGLVYLAAAFAAFKLGEWFGKLLGKIPAVKAAFAGLATGGVKLAQSLGLVRKAQGEVVNGGQALKKQLAIMDQAYVLTGKRAESIGQAMRVLKDAYEKTGTTGSEVTDRLAEKWKKAKDEAERLRDPVQALDRLLPGFAEKAKKLGGEFVGWAKTMPGVVEWWDELGRKMEALSPKAEAAKRELDKIFEKYNVMGKTAVTTALKKAEEDLELLRSSTEATPGAIAAIEEKIAGYRDQLSGFSASSQKVSDGIDFLNRRLKEMKEAWSEASGIDYDELLEFRKRLAEGTLDMPTEPVLIDIELDEGSMIDGKAKAQSFLEEIQAQAAQLGAGVTDEINRALEELGPGAVTRARNEVALLTMALDKFGDDLPQEQVRAMKARIEELNWALGDVSPWQKFVSAAVQAFSQVQALVTPIIAQFQQNAQIAIENEYKTRLDYINKTVADEEAKQKAIQALEAEFEIKKSKARAAGARTQKAMALSQAIINTAEGVTKALAQGGFLAGPIWAAIVAAMGAVQVAAIAAQPIPLAEGAVLAQSTLLTDKSGRLFEGGEAGPEYLLPEKKLVRIVQDAMALPRFTSAPALAAAASPAGIGSATINFNAPLVQTSGISRADLLRAGEEMKEIVVGQFRRMGRRV